MKNERGTWRLTSKQQLCKQCGTGKKKKNTGIEIKETKEKGQNEHT